MEVSSSEESEVKSHDLAVQLVPELSTSTRFDILLVADAPVDVLESDHPAPCYSLVWSRVVETPGDPFTSLSLTMLGSAHVWLGSAVEVA